jgi:SAM-dependent methyltransferase
MLSQIEELLVCPRCRTRLVRNVDDHLSCPNSDCGLEAFPNVQSQPVLIDFEESIVDRDALLAHLGASEVKRSQDHSSPFSTALQRLGASPVNEVARKFVGDLKALVGAEPTVLVIGGATIGSGMSDLYQDPDIEVVCFDVYGSAVTQLVADGHQIPLASDSVDAVVIQAVLEHVLDPAKVAAEAHRVLKSGGVVFGNTPFMQQVHEGRFDFTRFTDSGHRYLFRDFDLIDSGVSGGPGTVLLWSIDYFVRAFFRSRRLGYVAHIAFSWLARIDKRLDRSYSLDGASGVYFIGRKSTNTISAAEIRDYYQGAQ